tara:strand:+ start:387 stop:1100 length:714 start_codon:yes stop_codon:yes gene_type:complete
VSEFWINQVTPGYYDQILVQGIKKKSGIQSNWHNITFKKISKLITSKSEHLDYACGPGTFIGNYLKSNSIGVDISQQQINYAKKKYSNSGEFLTTEEFIFDNYNEKFDYITVIGLLEFIDSDEIINLVNKLNVMLKPSGKVCLTTPNYRGLMYFLEKFLNKFGKVSYENQVVNRFNKDSVEKLLIKSKFSKIKVKKILNFGVFFSLFSHKTGIKFENIIENIFKNYFGYILLIELKK